MIGLESLPEVCRERDVAKYLGISTFTLKAMCDDGQISYRKVRSRRVFLKEDIKEYWETIKCQKETGGLSLNGGQSETSGKLSGTKKEGAGGSLQAQKAAIELIKSLKTTRKEIRKERHQE